MQTYTYFRKMFTYMSNFKEKLLGKLHMYNNGLFRNPIQVLIVGIKSQFKIIAPIDEKNVVWS